MHPPHLILAASAAALNIANAQSIFNTTTSQPLCPPTVANSTHCPGPSLSTNIILRCTNNKTVTGNCNDNLSAIPPLGVKEFAPCYQPTPSTGDAACAYAGTVYPEHGSAFPVPGPGEISTPSLPVATSAKDASSSNSNNNGSAPHTSTSISYGPSATPTSLTDSSSALYPIPATMNSTGTASFTGTGTGKAPSKTSPPFTGAAERTTKVAAIVAVIAAAAAMGLMLGF